MTSSASDCRSSGTVRPSAFAVLRLSQVVLRRQLDRQISGLRAPEDTIDVAGSLPVLIDCNVAEATCMVHPVEITSASGPSSRANGESSAIRVDAVIGVVAAQQGTYRSRNIGPVSSSLLQSTARKSASLSECRLLFWSVSQRHDVGRCLPYFRVGQHAAPSRHAQTVLLPALRDGFEYVIRVG
jgi:hypothetical protein